jgi:hypothetical protein
MGTNAERGKINVFPVVLHPAFNISLRVSEPLWLIAAPRLIVHTFHKPLLGLKISIQSINRGLWIGTDG